MNILYIAYYTVKRLIKDKKSIFIKIITPIAMMMILGIVFDNSNDVSNLDKSKIGYLVIDKGEYGKNSIEMLRNQKEVSNLINFFRINSLDEGKEMLLKGEIDAVVYINKNFTEKLLSSSESANIEIYSNDYSSYKLTIIKNVINNYVNSANLSFAIKTVDNSEVTENKSSLVKKSSISSQENVPNTLSYYAITMLIFTLFYGAAYGCECIGEDYLGAIGIKLKSTPVKVYEQYIGKILGVSLANFIQGVIVILFSKFALHCEWGNSFLVVLFIALTFSILATEIGASICILSKDVIKSTSIISLIVPIFTFLAGGFMKVDFGRIMFLFPNYLAQTAIFNMVYSTNTSMVGICILILWCLIVLLSGFTVLLTWRRRQ